MHALVKRKWDHSDIWPILLNYKYLHRETSGWPFCLFYSIMLPLQLVFTCFGGAEIILMDNKNHDAITFAVSLIFKAYSKKQESLGIG